MQGAVFMSDSNGTRGEWWTATNSVPDPNMAGSGEYPSPGAPQAVAIPEAQHVVIPQGPEVVLPHHPVAVASPNDYTDPNMHVASSNIAVLPEVQRGVPAPSYSPVAQGRSGEPKPLQFSASAWNYFAVAVLCWLVGWIPFFGWAAFVMIMNGFIADHLRVAGRRVRFTMTYGAALWMVTRNLLVFVLTFGLGAYWIAVASWRQLYDSIEYAE